MSDANVAAEPSMDEILELNELGIHDINNVQGMILFNIGDAEMSVGELILRGHYLVSNISYNVKKMVEHGYLVQQCSVHDRRSLPVRGRNLRNPLSDMHQRNSDTIDQIGVSEPDLRRVVAMLRRLEQFWIEAATRLEAVPGTPP